MPLPFILGGIAIAATSYGAKKTYDGAQDKLAANSIVRNAQTTYEEKKLTFDNYNERAEKSLNQLGSLQLKIGTDFGKFRTIAQQLIETIDNNSNKDIKVDIPQHKLDKIKRLEISATSYLSKVSIAGVGGGAAAYAVYGGVMAFAAASTGTSIAALSGAAAYNATMAAIGGGSIAAGGYGMLGGAYILGGVVAAPIIAIAGWAFASHAEEALSDAYKIKREVNGAVGKMDLSINQLDKINIYSSKITNKIETIYTNYFLPYLKVLQDINKRKENGDDISNLDADILRAVGNGYQVAAILADIIATPLFKPKMNENGKVAINGENVVEFETDYNNLRVLNTKSIDDALFNCISKSSEYKP